MDPSETELIEAALTGDVEAFARLIEAERKVALRLAYVMAGPEAEDVTQDACVKAFRHLGQFRTDARFRPWFLAIVANEARNRHRRAGRSSALAIRVANRRGIDEPTPEEMAISGEDRDRLLAAVSKLPGKDREVVALRYFAGLTEAETAEALGCPKGTAKSRLSRALERLRADMSGEAAS